MSNFCSSAITTLLLGNLIKYESTAIKSQVACGVSNRLISRPQTEGGPHQKFTSWITTKNLKTVGKKKRTFKSLDVGLWFVYFLPEAKIGHVPSLRVVWAGVTKVCFLKSYNDQIILSILCQWGQPIKYLFFKIPGTGSPKMRHF